MRATAPLVALTGFLAAVSPSLADDVAPKSDRQSLYVALQSALVDPQPVFIEPAAIGADEVMRIDPVAVETGPLGFLRYNLEYIDVSNYSGDYNAGKFIDQTWSIAWDVGLVFGLTTAIGINNWEWGSSSFYVENEGWFGKDTRYAGVDKLAHAYSAYMLSEYFTQRIAHSADDTDGAFITGALLGFGVQSYIEFFDGYAGGHGFSPEDMVANAIGAGFSALRSAVPEIRDLLDYRIQYVPSGEMDFSPVLDYEGQKYLLALKLSGFESLRETPMRFVELHAGYYARNFCDFDYENCETVRREPYVGIGINLTELLNETPLRDTTAGLFLSRSFEYLQVPYAYVATSQD